MVGTQLAPSLLNNNTCCTKHHCYQLYRLCVRKRKQQTSNRSSREGGREKERYCSHLAVVISCDNRSKATNQTATLTTLIIQFLLELRGGLVGSNDNVVVIYNKISYYSVLSLYYHV